MKPLITVLRRIAKAVETLTDGVAFTIHHSDDGNKESIARSLDSIAASLAKLVR